MVLLNITVQIEPHKTREFLQSMEELIVSAEKGRQVPGRQLLYRQVGDENRFCLFQEWKTRSELENHLNSDGCHVLFGAMQVLGEIREVRVIEGDPVEYIHRLMPGTEQTATRGER